MAVPDPHTDELTLMSYEPRNRACKDLYKVPRKSDYIEVLWLLDNLPGMPTRWCPAEVLHVFGSPDQDCLGKGVIRYLPGDTWDQQFDFVDFMNGFKLRCSANHNEEEEEEQSGSGIEESQNENPCLEWRFTEVKHSMADQSDSDSDDSNWCIGSGEHEILKRRKTQVSLHADGDSRKGDNEEIRALRTGHSALAVELEKMKRQLLTMSNSITSILRADEQPGKCTSANCVLPRIRQKLALKMQVGLRQMPKPLKRKKHVDPDQDLTISFVDGILPGVITARVECTLRQFESVSRHVNASSSPDTVFFFPEFSYTQVPLGCSVEFRILFKTFTQLCDIIGISSVSDQKEMSRKCGNGPKGELLRLLGTYCYDEKDDRVSAHFFPGTSCGDASPRLFDHYVTDSANDCISTKKVDPLFPILTRRTREWNMVDGRYRHKLQKCRVPLPAVTKSCTYDKAFTMVWKRSAELGGRCWSEALRDSGEVFGWLELSIPFVQTVGKTRCQELGGVGNDDMWDEILRIGHESRK